MLELSCTGCGGALRVDENSRGKRLRCPKCGDIVYVPMEARATASASGYWRLRTPSGEQFGPVAREQLDQWATEGRVSADCQVLCEGQSRWRPAYELYPHLPASTARTVPVSAPQRVRTPAPGYQRPISDKSRIVAAVLAFFFGPLGIHRFYLGYPLIGLLMLFTAGGCLVWSFIDMIMIICGAVPDGEGRRLRD
jgi:predicted RNA-binding Zn-ribbon protein involved in translation (DUF1610 family)